MLCFLALRIEVIFPMSFPFPWHFGGLVSSGLDGDGDFSSCSDCNVFFFFFFFLVQTHLLKAVWKRLSHI